MLNKIIPSSYRQIIIKYWEAFFYSFPIRLIALQLRQHPFLMLSWMFIYSITGGGLLHSMGGQHQALEPEYLGEVSFLSYFMVGAAIGAFIFAYSITLYINASYKFPFLVLRRAPFFTFVFNNAIIPGFFLLMYFYRLFEFEIHLNYQITPQFWVHVGGFTLGGFLIFSLLFAGFFAASKNIFQYFGDSIQQELNRQKSIKSLRFLVKKAKEGATSPNRVDNYLRLRPLSFRKVDETEHLSLAKILQVLNQHHGNSLLLQMLFFLLIIGLGFLSDYPVCQLPVAASGMLTLALLTMIAGALTFWIRRMGFITFLILLGVVYSYYNVDALRERNTAFGLDYQATPAAYTSEKLRLLCSPDNIAKDHAESLHILNTWKENYLKKHGGTKLPRAVFTCTTGGGMRSALWTFVVLQHLDSLTKGKLTEEIRLMTGASGGMIGLAYFRELMMERQKNPTFNMQNIELRKPIAKDLLNRVFFQALTDACFPNLTFKIGNKKYEKEKGYAFDKQLMENVPLWKGKKLADYRFLEQNAQIPQLIITPSIINQGKQLFISPVGVSYLAAPQKFDNFYQAKIPGIEFRRFFEKQQADSIWFVTALRMNATFPFVLPLVSLPSEPQMFTMDAGAFDNFGMITSVKYLYEFRDWFAENVEEVVIISTKDTENDDPISDVAKGDVMGQIMSPIGGAYYSFMQVGGFANEYQMQYIKHWYPGKLKIFSFEYPWNELPEPATLSFRLTELEKKMLPLSLEHPHNKREFERLSDLYK